MHNLIDGTEWELPNSDKLPGQYIDIERLHDYIKMKKIEASTLPISSVGFRPLGANVNLKKAMYKKIDENNYEPVIVVEGMYNPMRKKYRMIDGKHRINKLVDSGFENVNAYVLDEETAMKFLRD